MRRWIVRTVLLILVAAAVLLIALVVNTLRLPSAQGRAEPATDIRVDKDRVAAHLAAAVRFKTVSNAGTAMPDEEFVGLQRYLDDTYPKLRIALSKETIGRHSLLYAWPGSDPRAAPVVLMAHQDVVPVEPGSEAGWTHPAFEGAIDDGYVWGRGTLDDKGALIATLEAVEALLDRGFQPVRTVLLAFGDDEEVGGLQGVKQVALTFRSRGIRPSLVVDEGGSIVEGVIPYVASSVALVGVGEKGFVSVDLTVQEPRGGHSSMPPAHTAIGILAAAIQRLEQNQVPAVLDGPTREMQECLAPEMSFPGRLIVANLWLFRPLVERRMLASSGTAAAVRTTSAVTMIDGGVKENVLPTRARAVVNFRIRPGETVDTVLEHVRHTIADPRVVVKRRGDYWSNPSPLTATEGAQFATMRTAIRMAFPDVVVAPFVFVGATDSRYFAPLSGAVLRFFPFRTDAADLERPHGINERVSVAGLADAVRFYQHLITTAAGS